MLFLTVWQFYLLVVVVGIVEVAFLTTMNLGLDRWDAMLVVPVFQVCLNCVQCVLFGLLLSSAWDGS